MTTSSASGVFEFDILALYKLDYYYCFFLLIIITIVIIIIIIIIG